MSLVDLTSAQKEKALHRCQNADAILKAFQSEHNFELPKPWKDAIEQLLLGGLTDPQLHLIFDTLKRVEFEAGRLSAKD